MKVLTVHNFYREPGGEDRVVENESTLLARHGHKVVPYTVHNDAIDGIIEDVLVVENGQAKINDAIIRRLRVAPTDSAANLLVTLDDYETFRGVLIDGDPYLPLFSPRRCSFQVRGLKVSR